MQKSIRWLSHAGFITANIVLVTHDHFDHVGNAVDIDRVCLTRRIWKEKIQ